MAVSILEEEIFQQPSVVRRVLEKEIDNARKIVARLQGTFSYVVIAARGSSDNAARYAQYLFGAHNQFQVALATPSLFTLYQNPPSLKHALIIGISQSGQSPDIVAVLEEGRKQGRPTLAIVNETNSPLAQTADFVVPLHADHERAVAATKTYTASLVVLAMLSCLLEENEQHLDQLKSMPELMQRTLEETVKQLPHVERYRYMDRCTVIGRGYNYATAFEIALKIKELSRVLADPYSSADFRHGPIAVIHQGYPVILAAPRGAVSTDITDLVTALKKLGSEQVIISDDGLLLEQANLGLPLPTKVPEWLTPLLAVLPGQLFALELTRNKGLDPDHPAGLTKVTETL